MFLFKRFILYKKESPVSILKYVEISLKPTCVQTLFLPDLLQQCDLSYFTTTCLFSFQFQNDTIMLERRGASLKTLHWRWLQGWVSLNPRWCLETRISWSFYSTVSFLWIAVAVGWRELYYNFWTLCMGKVEFLETSYKGCFQYLSTYVPRTEPDGTGWSVASLVWVKPGLRPVSNCKHHTKALFYVQTHREVLIYCCSLVVCCLCKWITFPETVRNVPSPLTACSLLWSLSQLGPLTASCRKCYGHEESVL